MHGRSSRLDQLCARTPKILPAQTWASSCSARVPNRKRTFLIAQSSLCAQKNSPSGCVGESPAAQSERCPSSLSPASFYLHTSYIAVSSVDNQEVTDVSIVKTVMLSEINIGRHDGLCVHTRASGCNLKSRR